MGGVVEVKAPLVLDNTDVDGTFELYTTADGMNVKEEALDLRSSALTVGAIDLRRTGEPVADEVAPGAELASLAGPNSEVARIAVILSTIEPRPRPELRLRFGDENEKLLLRECFAVSAVE